MRWLRPGKFIALVFRSAVDERIPGDLIAEMFRDRPDGELSPPPRLALGLASDANLAMRIELAMVEHVRDRARTCDG